jgi:hypothetical protein
MWPASGLFYPLDLWSFLSRARIYQSQIQPVSSLRRVVEKLVKLGDDSGFD